jgi:hypothetical protein
LSGLSFCKVVDYLLIGVSLLDIVVIEIDYCVAIWEYLSFNPIIENDFLLAIFVHSLYLAIVPNYLFNHAHVGCILIVVLLWELHIKLLCIIFTVGHCWGGVSIRLLSLLGFFPPAE